MAKVKRFSPTMILASSRVVPGPGESRKLTEAFKASTNRGRISSKIALALARSLAFSATLAA
jgi:hypothetical protein